MKEADDSDFEEMNRVISELGYYMIKSPRIFKPGDRIERWTRRKRKVMVTHPATIIGPGTIEDFEAWSRIIGRKYSLPAGYHIYRIIID